jgi:two-component system, OmpR family, response regulator
VTADIAARKAISCGNARVLVVDDESSIAAMLVTTLNFVGFRAMSADTGQRALDLAASTPPDLVLLDVMLPDLDGFEVCRLLRESGSNAPVLFLTALDSRKERLRGLTEGGDDYVTKPFDLNEVVARVGALVRRGRRTVREVSVLRLGWVTIDEETRDVFRDGEPVALSPTEFELLVYLVRNRGRVVSKRELLDAVWGERERGDYGTLSSYVYQLRRKLGDVKQELIRTEVRSGYSVPRPC